MTSSTIHLKDGMALHNIATPGQDILGIGVDAVGLGQPNSAKQHDRHHYHKDQGKPW
jgi:hypothetical protein